MRALAQARQQLRECERERDELRARVGSAAGELGKAYEAILALKQESETLRRELQSSGGRAGSGA
jgi:chromosome segregation ATPase